MLNFQVIGPRQESHSQRGELMNVCEEAVPAGLYGGATVTFTGSVADTTVSRSRATTR